MVRFRWRSKWGGGERGVAVLGLVEQAFLDQLGPDGSALLGGSVEDSGHGGGPLRSGAEFGPDSHTWAKTASRTPAILLERP